jgi:hypothetical protein
MPCQKNLALWVSALVTLCQIFLARHCTADQSLHTLRGACLGVCIYKAPHQAIGMENCACNEIGAKLVV